MRYINLRLTYLLTYLLTYRQFAVRKRKDFRWRLNVAVDDGMSFSSVSRRFRARGAATENARSSIRRKMTVVCS